MTLLLLVKTNSGGGTSGQLLISILLSVGIIIYKIFWILTFNLKTKSPSNEYQPFLDMSEEEEQVLMCMKNYQTAYQAPLKHLKIDTVN